MCVLTYLCVYTLSHRKAEVGGTLGSVSPSRATQSRAQPHGQVALGELQGGDPTACAKAPALHSTAVLPDGQRELLCSGLCAVPGPSYSEVEVQLYMHFCFCKTYWYAEHFRI